VLEHLKKGRIKKGLYEGVGRKSALLKIQWSLHKIVSENPKDHVSIIHSREKVHMSNIL
jgi:hypothetical protein